MRNRPVAARWLLLSPAMVVITVLYLVPLVLFLRYGFFSVSRGQMVESFTWSTYSTLLRDPFFWRVISSSLKVAGYCTLVSLVVGYPTAYAITRIKSPLLKGLAQAVIFVPLATSVVVRTYGWMVLFSEKGVLNFLATRLGLVAAPIHMVNTLGAVVTGMVHICLPFMAFSILSVLVQIDRSVEEAAQDLGATDVRTLRYVILPMSMPGVLAGIRLVFPLSLAAFVTPNLLGGGFVLTIPGQIYNDMLAVSWPTASVAGVVLLVLCWALMYLLGLATRKYAMLQA